MSNKHLMRRVDALVSLAEFISSDNEKLDAAIKYAALKNPWFTERNSRLALSGIKKEFLNKGIIEDWIKNYSLSQNSLNVGLVLAGNLPLVGFHDILCTFLSGHTALIKFSDKDDVLSKVLIEHLINLYPEFKNNFQFVDRLKNYDAVIATGSNNSARYFEYYFGSKPNIIRKNRNGIAILNGSETDEDLRDLSKDVFSYFGLGCRNVSKLYLPENYDLNNLLEIFHEQNEIILHTKYKNNYDYNISLFLLNRIEYLNNGSIILKEDKLKASRIACLHYEKYSDLNQLESELENEMDEIQCIASKLKFNNLLTVELGKTQLPSIKDYADGVDTMTFLSTL